MPHRHFQHKNVTVPFSYIYRRWSTKNALRYTVIEFVCSSRTRTWSPEKCATDIASSNLFVVWVQLRIPLLEVLKMRYRHTVIQFVYSRNAGRKEIIVKFEKIFQTLLFFSILYTKNESFGTFGTFWCI